MGEVTEEQKNFAVDAIIAMVVEDLSRETGSDPNKVLSDFIMSKTAKLLYETDTGCWKNGPTYIEDLYKEEG